MARPSLMASRSLNMVTFLGPFSADCGDAGEEACAGVAGGPDGENLVGQQREVVAEPTVAEAVVVGVAVNHAGHYGAAGVVGGVRGRVVGSAEVGGASYGGDGGAFEEDCAVGDGRAAPGVDQAVGGEDCEGGHGVASPYYTNTAGDTWNLSARARMSPIVSSCLRFKKQPIRYQVCQSREGQQGQFRALPSGTEAPRCRRTLELGDDSLRKRV